MAIKFNSTPATQHLTANKQIVSIAKNHKTNLNDISYDTVSFTGTNSKKDEKGSLSVREKQDIMKQARKTAAGWSILGGLISTLYFNLRSDLTVARKYDLDAQKDSNFIKEIKRQQTIQTIPSLFLYVGGIIAFGYNCFKNPQELLVA